MNRPDLARAVKRTNTPRFLPAVSALIASPTGQLALRRADTEHDPSNESWILLSTDGSIRGQFRIPRGFKAMSFRDCRVTGVMKDSLDQAAVVQFQIGSTVDAC